MAMPRKPPISSKFVLFDISEVDDKVTLSLDKLIKHHLKSQGRGNRADVQGIGDLMTALSGFRKGTKRLKTAYLNKNELSHPPIIEALHSLGIFNGLLTPKEISTLKQTGTLPKGVRPDIVAAAEYYVKIAVSLL